MLAVLLAATGCSQLSGDAVAPPTTAAPSDTAPETLAFVVEDEIDIATAPIDGLELGTLSLGNPSQMVLIDLLYDGLTEIDAVSGELRPALATSWSSNADATVWTFQIDESRISSNEIAASLDSAAEAAGSSAGVVLSAIDTIDARPGTVIINLTRPDAGLPWVLAGVPFSVATDTGGATGRYELTDLDDVGARLEPTIAGLPRVNVWFESDEAARGTMLVDGVADVAVIPDPVAPGVASRFLLARGADGVVADADVRSRVLGAIDNERMAQDLGARPGGSVTAPGLAGDRPPRPTDLAAAPDGAAFDRAIVVASIGGAPAALESVTTQLALSGLVVETVTGETAEVIAAWAAGEIDLLVSGWVAPSPTVDAVVWPLFGGESVANLAGWDAELDAAAAELDDDTRWGLLAEIEQRAIDDAVVVPLAHARRPVVSESPDVAVRADGTLDLG